MPYKGFELPPLTSGILIQRYKRFLADIELETGEKVTAHRPNSGSMKGCAIPGSQVWLSQIDKVYAQKLRKAVQKDVEIIAMDTVINTQEIRIGNALPVDLS